MSSTVLSLSGGLDSSTLLTRLIALEVTKVIPVIFTYGSKHNKYENQAALALCEYYKVKPYLFDLTAVMAGFKSNLLLAGGPIPEGHYNDASMAQTVVPGRNSIFITILAGFAESMGANQVALAVHAGDHHIYPDCRPDFMAAMQTTILLSSSGKVGLYHPYLRYTKDEIVSEGLNMGTPYHLTRTCYKDQEIACGKCGSCRERLEAFELNNRQDPISYIYACA